MGIHQSTVAMNICYRSGEQLLPKQISTRIQFPVDPADSQASKDDWHNKFAFPCAIGTLDCTHVQILKPGLQRR